MWQVRSPKRRVRDDDFCLGLSTDYPRIVFILVQAIQKCSAETLNSEFRGRRSIWWSWGVTPVAPRIVLNVLCETRIHHESHFSWQARRFIWDKDQSSQSVFVAGAIFGEVVRTPVAPRLVLDVSYVMGINHEVFFRGRRSICWSWSATFRGRHNTSWKFGR